MYALFNKLGHAVDFLIPRACPICDSPHSFGEENVICSDCEDSLERTQPPWCPSCGKPFRSPEALKFSPQHICEECQNYPPSFDSARALGPFAGLFRELIHLMKYQGHTKIAVEMGTWLGQLAEREINADSFPSQDELLITFVPINRERWKRRGYDQSQVLAISAAKYLELNCVKTLVRKKPSSSQTTLSAHYRKKNLKGVFAVKSPQTVLEKRILLIDDVLTTGSTASACARELKRSGAASVDVLTVCHTILRDLIS